MDKRIDIRSKDERCRYVFGMDGVNPIIVLALNPSDGKHPNFANGENYDQTQKRIIDISANNGYDGWIILNVFPFIETYSDKLCGMWFDERDYCEELINNNLEYIKEVLEDYPESDIWMAWGNSIEKDKVLIEGLSKIIELPQMKERKKVYFQKINKSTHPMHPLMMVKDPVKLDYSIEHLTDSIYKMRKLKTSRKWDKYL